MKNQNPSNESSNESNPHGTLIQCIKGTLPHLKIIVKTKKS